MHSPSADQDEAITQINVVPLVDIMLVLLIIFMLTASFIASPTLPVSVPKALSSDPALPASHSLVLTPDGELIYRERKVGKDELSSLLKKALALDPDLRIVLSADEKAPHGKVVEVLDLLKGAGVVKVALGVSPP